MFFCTVVGVDLTGATFGTTFGGFDAGFRMVESPPMLGLMLRGGADLATVAVCVPPRATCGIIGAIGGFVFEPERPPPIDKLVKGTRFEDEVGAGAGRPRKAP